VLNNALLATAAKGNVDDIINRKAEFKDAVWLRVGELAEQRRLGIVIDDCIVDIKAPRQLKDVFDQVTTSRQNREKLLNEANTYKDTTLLNASARASAITNEAATASANYVKYIQADAKAFTDLLPSYQSNPYLFTQQRVAEAMAQVLANVGEKKFIPAHADGKPIEVRLMLNNELPEKKPAANP
jgi:membrane protease subunit HflK